jgi:predicted enzyme related to lactoylglutathione lyase
LTVIDNIELPARRLSETKKFYSAVFEWDWIDCGPTYAATEGNSPEVGLNGLATTARVQPLGS